VPSVVEPSFGIGRVLYSLIEHSWYRREGDEARNVFGFPICVAPFKVMVAPLSNNDVFGPFCKQIGESLRRMGVGNKLDDGSASIGRRYARADELGIPLAITVDFQTVKDQTVTLRDRDSQKQIRESVRSLLQSSFLVLA
jgi:glycyl-tRNA synthetase